MSFLPSLLQRPPGLTCQQLVELVTDYLDGALPPRERKRFERHIGGCPHCTAYLQQLQVTLGELGELHEEDVAPEVRDELLEAFRGWRADADA
jgi:anti-sigma factor RsiW